MKTSEPVVANTIADVRTAIAAARAERGGPVVLVPTMGALHSGHISLVERAKQEDNAVVVVSIFVNPLQFAEGEDLDAYPRTLDEDVDKLRAVGADIVFAPSPREMYPNGPRTVIHPGGQVASILEGASRPTHFAGVLTVVNKLFNIVGPSHAVFGEKDYQQLLVIRQMVQDLDMDIEIIGAPIVREESGLAKSSRNVYLSEEHTRLAATLNCALREAATLDDATAVRQRAAEILTSEPDIDVDYVELTSADLGQPVVGENRLLVAARVGETRLIDNVAVTLTTV